MKKLVLVTILAITTVSFAQKRKDKEGNIKNLKGIVEYNLLFDYDNIKVDKFENEEEFLKDKMGKRDEKFPGEGKGEAFKKSWFADREGRYEPKFIESFNKRFDNGAVKVDKGLESAKHTMKIKTTWIAPGFNVGVMRRPSLVNTIITVYETANPSTILYAAEFLNAPGNGAAGYDFNSGYRISESYAKLAKTLAKHIIKKAK